MNKDAPRAGDKALCVHPDSVMFNQVVDVLSDPYFGGTRSILTGERTTGMLSRVFPPDGAYIPGGWACPTTYLIRIPPDSEAKQLFADEPIGVAA